MAVSGVTCLRLWGCGGCGVRPQECPTSGLLWAEDIKMTPRPAQRRRAGDALRKCDNDPHVLLQVALLFWREVSTAPTPTRAHRIALPVLQSHWHNCAAVVLGRACRGGTIDLLSTHVVAPAPRVHWWCVCLWHFSAKWTRPAGG